MSHALSRVSAHLLLLRDEKILLLRRANTGYEDGNYSVVAGHVDEGEQATVAMLREAQEEAAVTIAAEHLAFGLVMQRVVKNEKEMRVDFFFTTSHWKGEPRNAEPDLCDDLGWFDVSDLPRNMVEYVKTAIEGYAAGKTFLEFGE